MIKLAHFWRVYLEGSQRAKDPIFVTLTVLTAALCLWVFRLLKQLPRA